MSRALLETHALVLRRLGAKAAENWLTDILVSAKVVNPSVEDYIGGAVKLATFTDQSITLFDSVLAVLSTRLGVQVWTYDHHFDVMRTNVFGADESGSPSPHLAHLVRGLHHRLAGLARERRAEFRHIHHHAVDAVLGRGVRVGDGAPLRSSWLDRWRRPIGRSPQRSAGPGVNPSRLVSCLPLSASFHAM